MVNQYKHFFFCFVFLLNIRKRSKTRVRATGFKKLSLCTLPPGMRFLQTVFYIFFPKCFKDEETIQKTMTASLSGGGMFLKKLWCCVDGRV